jgi:FkbM family methyltransferase
MAAQYAQFPTIFREAPSDAIMLDIGGNVGLASMPVAALGRQVMAFEPVPINLRAFKLSVCFNSFADRVTLVGAAVGAADTTADIFVPIGRADNTAMVESVSTANVGGSAQRITVPVVALDSWSKVNMRAKDVARIWLVKIDVQGLELRVMEGAKALFGDLQAGVWVVAEHDPKLMQGVGITDMTADISFMAGLGFSVHLDWKGPEVPQSEWATVPLGIYGRDMWYRKM